jgi:glycosyltransferase involved in cell wall biosynthesis
MNSKPLVSVIIPCFNSGKTISRAVESILMQSWDNTEIIIVNDGSTDKSTINLLNYFSDNLNIKVYSQNNRGLAAARNSGIGISRGYFILPLDSDDWLDPNALKTMVEIYNESLPNSIVFSDVKLEGDRIHIKTTYSNPFEQLFSNQLPYCMLFPKEFLVKIGGYDENMLYGLEDWDLNIRLLINKHNFVKVNNPVFHYWISSEGMFQSLTLKSFEKIFTQIRLKYSDMYTMSILIKTMIESKSIPSNHKLFIYFIYNIIYKILPKRLFNFVYYSCFHLINLKRNFKLS